MCGLKSRDEGAEDGSGEDDGPGGSFGEAEEREGGEGEEDVGEGVEGCGGEGSDECGEENADYAGVDAAERGAEVGAGAEGAPEREDGGDEKQAGQKDADEGSDAVERGVVLRDTNGCAEVGTEGEERAGEGLGCSVAGEEGGLGKPVGGDDCVFEERKDYVAAAEDEGPAAIEGCG